jgi:hypothetical protein
MADKKSILEEALLDIKNIQNALNANTKEMLRSVAKEEIDSIVKESLVKEVYEEEDIDSPEGEEPAMDNFGGEEGSEDNLGDINSPEGEIGMEAPEAGAEMGMEPEMGMDTDVLGGEDEMDMTAASDDEVIAIFKKLSGEDEIEIVGDEIHMNISEPGEYIVKMNNQGPEGAEGLAPEMGGEEGLEGLEDMGGEADDVDYEIEMGDDEAEVEAEPETDAFGGEETGGEEEVETGEEEETEEIEEQIAQGTKGAHHLQYKQSGGPTGPGVGDLNESLKAKKLVVETAKKYNALLTEATKLKAENEEFRAALRDFRTKLVETVIFNANLSHATKLFLEHSTTKTEKDSIIKRFDAVSSLKESKKLYKTIAGELETRKPITESVETKIIKEGTSSISKQLNESTAYVDPSTKRIMDLIKRVENR